MTCPNCSAELTPSDDSPVRCARCLLWWRLVDDRLVSVPAPPARQRERVP